MMGSLGCGRKKTQTAPPEEEDGRRQKKGIDIKF
jgi:hypothetical protein